MIRALILSCVAFPALADVDRALDDHAAPAVERLAAASAALAAAACDPAALRPAFADAALAWAAVSHLNLGPVEDEGRGRAVFFWPDPRDATGRGLRRLEAGGETAWTPDAIARVSVAARGLGALERLIWEADAAPCALTTALTADLSRTATAIRDGWRDGFADLMRRAGAEGDLRFLAPEEAEAAFYTALLAGLEFTATQRLGRPLGSFDRPRPARAELRRSALSRDMTLAALRSLRGLADALAAPSADAPKTSAAFAAAIEAAEKLDDPAFAGVADPLTRIRVEAVQSAVLNARAAVEEEIGAALGVPAGFNSADGD